MATKFSFKKPWLFYDYLDMQKTIDEGEIYYEQGLHEKESQFKKPYKAATHPHSENEFSKPGTSGTFGPGGMKYPPGGEWPGGDCVVTGDAVGGGAIDPCNPSKSCGQWIFYCAHRISKFEVLQGNGWIQAITQGPNDTVIVTVCWNEGEAGDPSRLIGINAYEKTGRGIVAKTKSQDCLGPGHDDACTSCADCKQADHPPTLAFQSQQMTVSGTQALYATGGAGGPYTWAIVSGGGTLSINKTKNLQSTNYTAPPTNAECANNPTIRVTDYCGNTKDLKIAVNGYLDPTLAVGWSEVATSGNCAVSIQRRATDCGGTVYTGCDWLTQCGCDFSSYGPSCTSPAGCICPSACGGCSNATSPCPNGVSCFGRGWSSCPGKYDIRLAAEKTAGCCPAELL